jgi:hypothetical protein
VSQGPCPTCGRLIHISAKFCPYDGRTDFTVMTRRYKTACGYCKGTGTYEWWEIPRVSSRGTSFGGGHHSQSCSYCEGSGIIEMVETKDCRA